MRLLLVEDDARMRHLVSGGLTEEGHEVDSADSAAPALQLAGRGNYDVIVLDVMLSGASGLEIVRSLRTTGATLAWNWTCPTRPKCGDRSWGPS